MPGHKVGISAPCLILSSYFEIARLNNDLQGKNVRFINKYDEALSHLIFGGSEIILCHTYEDPVLQVPVCCW